MLKAATNIIKGMHIDFLIFLLQWWKFWVNVLYSHENIYKNIHNSLYAFSWFWGKIWREHVFLCNDDRWCSYQCWDPDPSSKLQAEFSWVTFIGRLNSSMWTISATLIRSTCRKRAETTAEKKCKDYCFTHFKHLNIHYCMK